MHRTFENIGSKCRNRRITETETRRGGKLGDGLFQLTTKAIGWAYDLEFGTRELKRTIAKFTAASCFGKEERHDRRFEHFVSKKVKKFLLVEMSIYLLVCDSMDPVSSVRSVCA